MHELSIAEGILSAIEQRLGGKKILTRINLSIGPLAGVSAESLEFWFSEIAKDKGFGAPALEINKTQASAVCAQCKNTYEVKTFYSGCPQCGAFERTVQSGYECVIDSIEMETE
ncbi:MAG: hydrogenase maturation nickel metallochaperone HypA [Chitinivibrionales bacterium]